MNTNFNVFTEIVSELISSLNDKLPETFAIEVDDKGSLYLKSLMNLFKKYISIDTETIKNTEFGDVIFFGNNNIRRTNIVEAVFANVTILSLVKDYNKVEKYVINFFENVYVAPKKPVCKNCPLFGLGYMFDHTRQDNSVIYDGTVISVDEKVSIMYNFVKIGYDQYDIINIFGRKLVDLEGTTYEVKTDRRGRKFLEVIK